LTQTTIENAQECLTVINGNQRKKIIDIENLLHKHNKDMVLDFLHGLSREYETLLKNLFITDRTSPKIDYTVSRMFRVCMAIRTIERESEEVMAA